MILEYIGKGDMYVMNVPARNLSHDDCEWLGQDLVDSAIRSGQYKVVDEVPLSRPAPPLMPAAGQDHSTEPVPPLMPEAGVGPIGNHILSMPNLPPDVAPPEEPRISNPPVVSKPAASPSSADSDKKGE